MKDPKKIERAIGRLQSKHSRVNRYYDVEVVELPLPAPTEKKSSKEKALPDKRIKVTRKDKTSSETELCGCAAYELINRNSVIFSNFLYFFM